MFHLIMIYLDLLDMNKIDFLIDCSEFSNKKEFLIHWFDFWIKHKYLTSDEFKNMVLGVKMSFVCLYFMIYSRYGGLLQIAELKQRIKLPKGSNSNMLGFNNVYILSCKESKNNLEHLIVEYEDKCIDVHDKSDTCDIQYIQGYNNHRSDISNFIDKLDDKNYRIFLNNVVIRTSADIFSAEVFWQNYWKRFNHKNRKHFKKMILNTRMSPLCFAYMLEMRHIRSSYTEKETGLFYHDVPHLDIIGFSFNPKTNEETISYRKFDNIIEKIKLIPKII